MVTELVPYLVFGGRRSEDGKAEQVSHVPAGKPPVAAIGKLGIVLGGIVFIGFDGLVMRDAHGVDALPGIVSEEADLSDVSATPEEAHPDPPVVEHIGLPSVEHLSTEGQLLSPQQREIESSKQNKNHALGQSEPLGMFDLQQSNSNCA